MDISIRFPADGRIDIRSEYLFGDLSEPMARAFVERAMRVATVERVTIRGKASDGGVSRAEIYFDARKSHCDQVIASVIQEISRPHELEPEVRPESLRMAGGSVRSTLSNGSSPIDTHSTATLLLTEVGKSTDTGSASDKEGDSARSVQPE